jgi:hypothetical protein
MINEGLDTGSSRPTATFASPCLASGEIFDVCCVECWQVQLPAEDDEAGRPDRGNAMDRFQEDKCILEMNCQQMHSDGYRAASPVETD